MPNFFIPIGLILYSVVVVLFRKRLKAAFNSKIGFKVKQSIFSVFLSVPFAFIFGSFDLYSKVQFYMNYDTYVPLCLAKYEAGAAEVLSIEYEVSAVFIKFKKTGSADTFWCENKSGIIRFFR
jgi:hypothetical protein